VKSNKYCKKRVVRGGSWRRDKLSGKYRDEVKSIRYIGGNHKRVSITNGRHLKEAEVAKELLECDVFINMPIAKDHTGVRFTGTMKNMMGASPYSTNGYFHHGSGASGYYDDVEFLSQCIADLNLVRQPDLCLFDGTEVITTNRDRATSTSNRLVEKLKTKGDFHGSS